MSDRLQEAKSLLVATEGVPSSDWLDTDRPKMRDLLVWAVSEVQRLRDEMRLARALSEAGVGAWVISDRSSLRLGCAGAFYTGESRMRGGFA